MGIILSRFRKKKTTIEILENLDKQIKEIEQYGQHTEQRHKRIVGTLILYSVALYTITAIIFYFYFFPASLYDQLFYITPLLIFPFLILFTKKMVSWYYKRKISRNQDKLLVMQEEKKKILEDVTETETYKKAKEILLKFAPDQLRMSPLSPQIRTISQPNINATPMNETPRRPGTPQNTNVPIIDANSLRRRTLAVSNLSQSLQQGKSQSVTRAVPVGTAPDMSSSPITPFQTGPRPFNSPLLSTKTPLPRPILPQQRSYVDRLIEYLVGDGPSNRYALICRQCESHNGMALKEEFEYFGFRCCYCNFWNPARKQKPSAPKLELDHTNTTMFGAVSQSSKTSDMSLPSLKPIDTEIISSTSDSDSDIEVVEKPGENGESNEQVVVEEEDNNKNCENKENAQESKMSEESQNEKMDIDESPMK